ncbi:hypothetical protein [Verminephrobacter eiseniae]|uniref:hypothetical protein n=1 Tax=Verminephrobacter eiseniae TaxID=364317 RepID=UPI0022388221|nr:hypothetical protein [Verminephrobacter eiseniae]
MSRHRSDVVGCAQPSERSARRIAQPIPSVLASDATPRCASMASADRQMIGDATLARDAAGRALPSRWRCPVPQAIQGGVAHQGKMRGHSHLPLSWIHCKTTRCFTAPPF